MALIERVSTLLRANLNDLLDKAEDPEKLSKQVLLDMENQLLQVKTQVAIALAEQHRLRKQQQEHEDAQAQWHRKAQLAVAKAQDDLARAALERGLSHQNLAEGFARQYAEQQAEAESLRAAYAKLQGKLSETQGRVELLLSQHRRNRAIAKTSAAKSLPNPAAPLSRLAATIAEEERTAQSNHTVQSILAVGTLDERFHSLEQEDRIEALLLELKQNQPRLNS